MQYIDVIIKSKESRIKYKNCEYYLECKNVDLIVYKYLCFNENYQKNDGDLKKRFANTYNFITMQQ